MDICCNIKIDLESSIVYFIGSNHTKVEILSETDYEINKNNDEFNIEIFSGKDDLVINIMLCIENKTIFETLILHLVYKNEVYTGSFNVEEVLSLF